MVFYRKYRPQTIEELDSAAIRDTFTTLLTKAQKTDWESLPHAFLFTGPKGLGKTSTARILGKAINCEHAEKKPQKTFEPCNICDQCLSIMNGTNLDILEIDAASNRGIDEIRDLKEKIRLAPVRARKKIYIIDEVHMLTTEAFNALLKTLEEPPSHAVFILCTTEPHKVPQTILSRCFHVQFTPATIEEIVRSFQRIATAEKIDVSDETLKKIARMADGGFRDGVKILEEAAAFGTTDGKVKITDDLLEAHFKRNSLSQFVTQAITLFEKKDTKELLLLIDAVTKEGISVKEFVSSLTAELHHLLLQKFGLPGENVSFISSNLSVSELSLLLQKLGTVQEDMKYAVLPQLPFELMVIDVCIPDDIGDEPEAISVTVSDTKLKSDGVTLSHVRKKAGDIVKIKALYGDTPAAKEAADSKKITADGVSLMHLTDDGIPTQEWVDQFWRSIIDKMKTHNHTIAGVLRGCMPKSFDKKTLIIETAYKFHKEKLDNATTKSVLEQVCKELTGSPISISIMLKS